MVRKEEIPEIIPPQSSVKLKYADENTPEWKGIIGKVYRVGYYSKQDGLGVIWLVDEYGQYYETTSKEYLLKYFEIVELSTDQDYFGDNSKPLGPLHQDTIF